MAGLSAVVNGLIAPYSTSENPIFHINGISGSGKTTGAELSVSAFGASFQGASKERHSLLGSWGATANAVLRRCEGNLGAVVVFNELGKFADSDATRIIYDLSEGTDRERLSSDLEPRRTETFFTTFISTGETSLLDRCKSKVDGLPVRVMEITEPLTDSADHANRIKAFCHANFGQAAPMLAKHIIDRGGFKYAVEVYGRNLQAIIDKFPEHHFRSRFVEKFPALILATAEMAADALEIYFNIDDILNCFVKYAEKRYCDGTSNSYEIIIEECRKNINSFYRPKCEAPRGLIYGKIAYPNKEAKNGKTIAEEYAVRISYVDKILSNNGFQNKRTCIEEWMREGVVNGNIE